MIAHQRPLPHLIPNYERMRQQVAACVRVDEAKDIRDKAEALRAYARKVHDIELETKLAEIKLHATRRIGEISAGLDKAPHGPGRGNKSGPVGGTSFKRATLKAAGISKSPAHRAEQLARIPKEEFERVIAEHRQNHQPVRYEDVVRSVVRKRQLQPLRRATDGSWRGRIMQIIGVQANTGEPRPGLQALEAVGRMREEEKVIHVMMVLAKPDLLAPVFMIGDSRYHRLLRRLMDGDYIEAVLHRLSELQPENHKGYLEGLMKQGRDTELASYLMVDWSEVTYGAEEEQPPAPVGEELQPVED